MNRTPTVAPVEGKLVSPRLNVSRCTAGLTYQVGGGYGYNGDYAQVAGCELAFAFPLRSGDTVGSVTCPSCGAQMGTTTRRLRQGFLVLTEADVKAIQDANGYTAARGQIRAAQKLASRAWAEARRTAEAKAWADVKGVPTEVSVLSPIVAPAATLSPAHAAMIAAEVAEVEAPAPAPVKSAKLEAAEASLAKFDAKPRCSVCWAYNASARRGDVCGWCRSWGNVEHSAQASQSERDGYTWRRQEMEARVVKAGGTPAPSPVPGYAAHIAERDARRQAERARRIAELRARGVRV